MQVTENMTETIVSSSYGNERFDRGITTEVKQMEDNRVLPQTGNVRDSSPYFLILLPTASHQTQAGNRVYILDCKHIT
jgi:hypothetical protein